MDRYGTDYGDKSRIMKPYYEIRMDICQKCDKLKIGFCSQCGCLMSVKTRLKASKCPLQKWTKERLNVNEDSTQNA